MDVAVFLTAQYDEKERAIRANAPFKAAMAAAWPGLPDGVSLEQAERRTLAALNAAYPHTDAACVLDDIAAKRELLALWQETQAGVYSPDANRLAEDMLEQLLAPYGKRAVWNSDTGYQIDE